MCGNSNTNGFKCDLWDFTTSAKNGVSVRRGHKHKDIENILDEDNEKSLNDSSVSEIREETVS